MPAKTRKPEPDMDEQIGELREKLLALLRKKGGSSTSEAKIAASRENGKLGGRPKKAQ